MTKWEYCAIGPTRGAYVVGRNAPLQLRLYTKNGVTAKRIQDDVDFERTIAELGLDGWELTGVGNFTEVSHYLYFKRPISN